jgi:hypothetical protein
MDVTEVELRKDSKAFLAGSYIYLKQHVWKNGDITVRCREHTKYACRVKGIIKQNKFYYANGFNCSSHEHEPPEVKEFEMKSRIRSRVRDRKTMNITVQRICEDIRLDVSNHAIERNFNIAFTWLITRLLLQ